MPSGLLIELNLPSSPIYGDYFKPINCYSVPSIMLETLITSKTRLKLIFKLFLNPETSSYLRGLAEEFGESSNAIRVELNRLEGAGLLCYESSGNKKMFRANTEHPLYDEIHSIVKKTFGIDKIVDEVVERLGDVQEAYITGDFAIGVNGPSVDIALVGKGIQMDYLVILIAKAEKMIGKKIQYVVLLPDEAWDYLVKIQPNMLFWKKK
jgi:hypothetical protein